MPRLLVTNCGPEEGGVYLLDTESGALEQLHHRLTRGIVRTPMGIYFVEHRGVVLRLNARTLAKHRVAELDLWGCHDIRWYDDHFYVVECGANRVRRYDPDFQFVDELRILDADEDVCHPNCLIRVDGQLLLTIFTLSPGARHEKNTTAAWRTEGKVLRLDWDAKRYEVVYEPLGQPHSLVPRGHSLFCCESITSDIVRLRLGERKKRMCRLHGFVRGLVMQPGRAFVGISQLRGVNATLPQHLFQRNRSRLPCGVIELDTERWKPVREWAIPGTEVYDILVLDLEAGSEAPQKVMSTSESATA